ncbi:type II toxin-antitoxin system RelE/ParE family toxin [Martelella soudanensis]|uniref:type II toxin-antitoxin system RelE/ParE family toxin n=1 Tax=unclassified Martelella TaxID=2629616 RepID=UPI0015DF293B|nr:MULTISPECIES: type II toxin-antitoxin system RelE/ParE family toxin [unclassified Martelella]
MAWNVVFDDSFADEFKAFDKEVKIELRAMILLLGERGPELGRPRADTLNGSKYANMKELRFNAADGAWRAAFAFDPHRKAVILVAADKSGTSEKKFYKTLIGTADKRYKAHLNALEKK